MRFFRPAANSQRHHATLAPVKNPYDAHRDGLKRNGLLHVPEQALEQSKQSARMFYVERHFPPERRTPSDEAPFSLHRIITKVPAVCVSGDNGAILQDSTEIHDRDFFLKLQPGNPRGLAITERLSARKALIASKTSVFSHGGYPFNSNPRVKYDTSFNALVISQAAPQFEIPYLEYSQFILDPFQIAPSSNEFSYYYEPHGQISHKEAQRELSSYDANNNLARIRPSFLYLTRSPQSGKFRQSLFSADSLILNKSAYFNALVEDIVLHLAAVDKYAAEDGREAYFKATAAGMGFFARIDQAYDISDHLFPILLSAYEHVLTHYEFKHIGCIEFPLMEESQQYCFNLLFSDKNKTSDIKTSYSNRDVLDFAGVDQEKYLPALLNPGDANALPGNEWGDDSVEAMIGNNTTIRHDQVYLMNSLLLHPSHQIGVDIIPDKNSYRFIEPKDETFSNTPLCLRR